MHRASFEASEAIRTQLLTPPPPLAAQDRGPCHLAVYAHTPDDIRLARKLMRKIEVQRQDPLVSLRNYLLSGRDRHAEHVAPSRHRADLVLDGTMPTADLLNAVDHLVGAQLPPTPWPARAGPSPGRRLATHIPRPRLPRPTQAGPSHRLSLPRRRPAPPGTGRAVRVPALRPATPGNGPGQRRPDAAQRCRRPATRPRWPATPPLPG